MKTTVDNHPLRRSKKRTQTTAFILIAIGFVLCLFRSTLTDYTNGMAAQDGIYMPNPSYQFSKAEAKEGLYSHTFRIYNLRPRRLAVEAHPDCGCTRVSWEKATILPFGWKDLTAEMKANKSNVGSSVAVGLRLDSSHQPWLFAFLKS